MGVPRVRGVYFNPRSPGGERRRPPYTEPYRLYFNPRSPGGERHYAAQQTNWANEFQSTLPGWGATRADSRAWISRRDFNPRSPGGERRANPAHPLFGPVKFQSTLPGWGATRGSRRSRFHYPFQSTLPGWGATVVRCAASRVQSISIHAPRVGSDHRRITGTGSTGYFNPRSPGGERRP